MRYFLLIIGCILLFHACVKGETLQAGDLTISRAAKDLILYYEVGGSAYYVGHLERPTVPPGASGITIGIGYDLVTVEHPLTTTLELRHDEANDA